MNETEPVSGFSVIKCGRFVMRKKRANRKIKRVNGDMVTFTLGTAMEAKVTDHAWTIEEILNLH
jgi:hypothetical protein